MPIQRNYLKTYGMKRFFLLLCFTVILISCTRNPLKINVSTISVDLKIKHLDVDLLKLKQDQVVAAIPVLKSSHGEFFDLFTYRMINIGGTEQENFPEMLYSFVSDTLIRELETNVAENIDTINSERILSLPSDIINTIFQRKKFL